MSNGTPQVLGNYLLKVATWNPVREATDQEIRYVDLSSVDNQTKRIVGWQTVFGQDAPSRARQLVRSGDILVSTVRPNLNGVARVPEELDGATASTGFCVLRAHPRKLSPGYLFQWAKSPKFVKAMVQQATGASYPAVSDRIIFASSIPIVPLAEQRRIAAILDQADELRRKRRMTMERLDALVVSTFVDLFGNPADNPRGWARTPLGELIDSGPQNGLYKPSSDYGSGTPILRIDAFYDGLVTDTASLKRVRISPEEKRLYGLFTHDIIINRVNSLEYLGKSALITELSEDTVFESNMMRFSVRKNIINPRYLIQFLQDPFIKSQISSSAKKAVNQASINQKDVCSFLINVPDLSSQQRFEQHFEVIQKLRSACVASRANFDTLFASLQHRAFNGELTSEAAERELAEAV